uniref:reverse transcriptase domain-containing protein n=1 Tax=uncultured Erythrobacter sp. TaxID=263913 RepID=UPI00260AA5BC|nr:reverse transcriptase domain-containing protein [uncultured Erythrobacter sp.]
MTTSIANQRRFKRRLLTKIKVRGRAAQSTIGRPLLKKEIDRFLASHATQSLALYKIWQKEDRETAMSQWRQWQSPSVPYKLQRLSVGKMAWYPKKRSTSGFRKICLLPTQLKMWHSLAKDLVCALYETGPHIGGWPGRSRDKQVREVAGVITSRDQWVVVADVVKAFASFNPNTIYQLHSLPENLLRRAIDSRRLKFTGGMRSNPAWAPDKSMCDDLEMGPTGLLEGSPASNAIFSVFMDDLPDHMPDGITPFVYCDNIILVCPSEALAQQAATSLVEYLSRHQAGPFEVRYDCQPVWHEFDHLGYSIRHNGGFTSLGLASKNWMKLQRKIEGVAEGKIEPLEWLRTSFAALQEHERFPYEMMIADGH